MICKTYETGSLGTYKYVVVLSVYQGKILLSRRRDRRTWETQGGHIEAGETPLEAAKRELYEESGASEFVIQPVCDYWAGDANGMVFRAEITVLSDLPESEMAEVRTFDRLPENLTYPAITPVLFEWLNAPKNLKARYKNAICLILDEDHIYEAMDEGMASEPFIITSKPHSAIRKKGFPLDSLSIDLKTGKYYYDLEEGALDQVAVEDGFLEFFQKHLSCGV